MVQAQEWLDENYPQPSSSRANEGVDLNYKVISLAGDPQRKKQFPGLKRSTRPFGSDSSHRAGIFAYWPA